MMTYDTIKEMAKDAKCKVNDLLALHPNNDPFYTGMPREIDAAYWFKDVWTQHCEQRNQRKGIHLRRVHYWAIDGLEPPLRMPNGQLYQNTMVCWGYLNVASKYARYLGLVDPAAFEDRQVQEVHILAHFEDSYYDPTPSYQLDTDNEDPFEDLSFDLPGLPELSELQWRLPYLPDFNVWGYDAIKQPYLVEVWTEKSTMNDVLIPLCRHYNVNLIVGKGELSITAVILFLERVREADRPARILYVSDYDPAGMGMPISVARKVEYYQRTEGYNDLDIRLEPAILTADQIDTYNLPRTPIKDSDLKKANWEALHGKGATELDSLEGRHPGEMARIIEQAILNYYDPTLTQRAKEEKRNLTDALIELKKEITEPHQAELDAATNEYAELQADFEKTRERFTELVTDFQPEIDAYTDRLEAIKERFRWTYSKLYADLDAVNFDAEEEYPLPEPDLPEESDALLYGSYRDYMTQLAYYKEYRGNSQ